MLSVDFTEADLKLIAALVLPERIRAERRRWFWPSVSDAADHLQRVQSLRSLSEKVGTTLDHLDGQLRPPLPPPDIDPGIPRVVRRR